MLQIVVGISPASCHCALAACFDPLRILKDGTEVAVPVYSGNLAACFDPLRILKDEICVSVHSADYALAACFDPLRILKDGMLYSDNIATDLAACFDPLRILKAYHWQTNGFV